MRCRYLQVCVTGIVCVVLLPGCPGSGAVGDPTAGRNVRSLPLPGGSSQHLVITQDIVSGSESLVALALPDSFSAMTLLGNVDATNFFELGANGEILCPPSSAGEFLTIRNGCLVEKNSTFNTDPEIEFPDPGTCGTGMFPVGPMGVGDMSAESGCVAMEASVSLSCSQANNMWRTHGVSTWRLVSIDDLTRRTILGDELIPAGTTAVFRLEFTETWTKGDFSCGDVPPPPPGAACCTEEGCEDLPGFVCGLAGGTPVESCDECRYCGDGRVLGEEMCDPPDNVTCNENCESITCGDGIVEGEESCDPPNATSCGPDCRPKMFDECNNGHGNCFTPQASPGCQNPDTCNRVCRHAAECCEAAWDDSCAELAVDSEVQACCLGGTVVTCLAFDAAGCRFTGGEPLGLGSTCADSPCVEALTPECLDAGGNCFEAHSGVGCDVVAVCHSVCMHDASCCDDGWDEGCARRASELPRACCFDFVRGRACLIKSKESCDSLPGGIAFEPGTTCEDIQCGE